ncbi:DNase, TatD family [Bifidobacterium actinocoloniiforme DSM 22766]|uniref:DNase, TatD family n=1 Tax=Bifidobacterium actinocoloniiforme DSM 22766 TaxID=1437605 RepID=A0A086YYE3_9BIFI|nr:TatD family hydrolase [Bifidobacterium actinocoloniiforme]AKV55847.1 hydrolase TatD [Bifidobacterium actinocoloniiforme DSM 22766]KFI39293.1 DNase, TatD family [Bifidobacterium actinocoloniiforme DSM 22766]
MSKHHRKRQWAPAPQELPDGVRVADDHTHLASVPPFAAELDRQARERGQDPVPVYSVDQMIDQAQAVGVEAFLDVGCELLNLERAVQLSAEHPGVVYAGLAIHPNEAVLHGHRGVPGPDGLPVHYQTWHDIPYQEAFSRVAELAQAHPREVVAIGETGMDLYRTGAAAEGIQRQAFRDHIALAKELGLPLQIHDRDAHSQVIETLLADGAPERTVFHSYSGDAAMAQVAAEHGWYLSCSGSVSYKGNEGIRQSLSVVGLDHIMVETDAPYLAPMPYRGRANAPYMIPYTLSAMADALDLPLEQVAQATRETTRRVYGF